MASLACFSPSSDPSGLSDKDQSWAHNSIVNTPPTDVHTCGHQNAARYSVKAEGRTSLDDQGGVIDHFLPQHESWGAPCKLRTTGCLVHLLRTGALCPPGSARSTVYELFRRLADGGWLARSAMPAHAVRELQGRDPAQPSASSTADGQVMSRWAARHDNARKINGGNRHILADNISGRAVTMVQSDRYGGIALCARSSLFSLDRPHRRRQG